MNPVDLTARLVRVPSLSGQEGPVADIVEETMRNLGYREVIRDRLGSIIGLVGPADAQVRLLFDGHMDVVPVVGEWCVDPFGAAVVDGRLYGRGSTDMKGGLSAAICGVVAAASSGRLLHQVAVSATVLEETIEGVALGEVIDAIAPSAVVICEPTGLQLKVGQRGRLEILIKFTGVPAHAAFPERGTNALSSMARAIAALEGIDVPVDPVLGKGILVPTDVLSTPYPSISMLPSSALVRFDRRTLVGETPEAVVSAIESRLSDWALSEFEVMISAGEISTYTGVTFVPQRVLDAWNIDRKHALVQAAVHALEQTDQGVDIGTFAFCTNGSESAGARNIPTIGLGPGAEDDAHTIDESVSLAEIGKAAKFYEKLALEFAGVS